MKKTFLPCAGLIAALFLILAGCIHNDIPYPRIQANFLSFEVEGMEGGAVIDSTACTIDVKLSEGVDPASVTILGYTLTPGAHVAEPENFGTEPIDLTTPLSVEVELYQTYNWLIRATQDIERYFSVEGQIGTAIIDAPGHRVVIDIPMNADIAHLKVESIKLAGPGAVYSPAITAGSVIDLSTRLDIMVSEWGRDVTWSIYANKVEATVTTERVDAWSCVAWVYGKAEAGKDNGVEYRLQGSTEWTRLPADQVTHNGGDFTGCINFLSPNTAYEARTFSDSFYGEVVKFETGSIVQVPNSDFDSWWLDGKVWDPWPEGGLQVWDSGNKGATTLGTSNTFPTEDTPTGTGLAAQLETRFVGIGAIGKLAAGNIFVGRYVRTDGTNGVLSFGYAFTERPTRLKGYLKYKCANISHASADFKPLVGQPDTCIVWCALIDSDEPFEIRTNPKDRNLFDPQGSYVVAYGRLQYGESVANYIPFDIKLDYTSTSRVPKYILITASASKYGDYFTGGAGSTLWVDDFELVYDY